VTVAQGYFVLFRETEEFIPMYPVLSARQAEGNQIAFFNPP